MGAGTCEFLVAPDGTISFLEVNTRLQVEHCVSEEVTGLDLVREHVPHRRRGAARLRRPRAPRHSIEFRINGEDAGRGFLPQPGTVTRWRPPAGPGVRLDSGVVEGIGRRGRLRLDARQARRHRRDRAQALERSRRALAEFVVEGMPTVLPFHRAVVADPAFAPADPHQPFSVHTRWIETEFGNTIEPWPGDGAAPDEPDARERIVVEVGGKRLEVCCPPGFGGGGARGRPRRAGRPEAVGVQGREGRGVRRRPHLPDAGHDRQARRRGGADGRRRATWSWCSRR